MEVQKNQNGQEQDINQLLKVRREKLADLQKTNEKLAEDIANSQDPELIEEVAREDLGMVAPGEKIIRFSN